MFGKSHSPSPSTTNPVLRGINSLLGSGNQVDLAKRLLMLRLEKIGRGNAGKSALEWAFARATVSSFSASGLQLDVENPQLVAELIAKDRAIRSRLENDPLLPTTEATPINYFLYEGETPRCCLASHEVIGQILQNTTPSSPQSWKEKYQEYMTRLPAAHMLWVMIPIPPLQATGADRERFENDLRLTVGYLREALKLRTSDSPVVVALLLTRVDSRYDDVETARRELTDEVVLQSLMPLVRLVQMSGKVSEAAAFVTSAYGFGSAVRKPDVPPNGENNHPTDQDGQWTLLPGAHIEPFNLSALAVWTLYHGLFEQKVDETAPEARTLTRVLEHLRYDLDNTEGWIIPVKSREATRHA